MIGFDARHAVTSPGGTRVLFAAHERLVAIGDLGTGTLSAAIETTFDAGAARFALCDKPDGILAAAYHVHGPAFYSAGTGQEVWRRKDIKKVQRITLSRDGRRAYCGCEGGPLVPVKLEDGRTGLPLKGVRWLHESPFEDASFADAAKPWIEAGGRKHTVKKTTFAFLAAAFAPGCLSLSEAAGPVRCFETVTGAERWKYEPRGGSHVLSLGYRAAPAAFLGVEWPFERGGPMQLLQFAVEDGRVLGAVDIGCPCDVCFALGGTVAVTTAGEVIDTVTGGRRPVF